MEITKELILHAVIGKGFKCDYADEGRMEARGLARFSGNQWNEAWEWNRKALFDLSIEELQSLYNRF